MQIHLKLVNRDPQVISFLRFPMIIGVVLIHSGIEMGYHFLPQTSENHIVSDLQFIFYYFLIAAIWIAIFIGIYELIRKTSPKLSMFISGGR